MWIVHCTFWPKQFLNECFILCCTGNGSRCYKWARDRNRPCNINYTWWSKWATKTGYCLLILFLFFDWLVGLYKSLRYFLFPILCRLSHIWQSGRNWLFWCRLSGIWKIIFHSFFFSQFAISHEFLFTFVTVLIFLGKVLGNERAKH